MKKTLVSQRNRLFQDETARGRILAHLLLYPNVDFGLSELARSSGVSKASASRVVQALWAEDIVKVIDKAILWRIEANSGSWPYLKEKIPFNIALLYRSGIAEYLAEKFGSPKAIVVFGSFRSGEDIIGSDIDIAIESDKAGEPKVVAVEGLETLERQLARKFRVLLFHRQHTDKNLFNSIANGIVLYGFLEVSR